MTIINPHYYRSAQLAGITIAEYLSRRAEGLLYCRSCCKWLKASTINFFKDANTLSGFRAACKRCEKSKRCTKGQSFGRHFYLSAKMANMTIDEFMQCRENGLQFCRGCRRWQVMCEDNFSRLACAKSGFRPMCKKCYKLKRCNAKILGVS